MTPETANLLIAACSDAVKILGPAIIAAIAAYKGAYIQLSLKMKELDAANSFRARELLFDFYKEKVARLRQERDKASETNAKLWEQLGYIEGAYKDSPDETREILEFYIDVMETMGAHLPAEIDSTRRDLERYGLHDTGHLSALERLQVPKSWRATEPTVRAVGEALARGAEILSVLHSCNEALLEHQAEAILSEYAGRAGRMQSPARR